MDNRQQYPPQYYQQQGYAPIQQHPQDASGRHAAQPARGRKGEPPMDDAQRVARHYGWGEVAALLAIVCGGVVALLGTSMPALFYWIAYPAGIILGSMGVVWAKPGTCYRWMSLSGLVICSVMMVGLANVAWLASAM